MMVVVVVVVVVVAAAHPGNIQDFSERIKVVLRICFAC